MLGLVGWLFFWWGVNRNGPNSKQQVLEFQAPEINLSGALDGIGGGLKAVEKLRAQTERLRENESHSTDKINGHE